MTLETDEPTQYRPRRSRHTPAAQGSKWIRRSTRWAIYHRDDFACVYCGRVPRKTTRLSLDHVRPVESHGRRNAPEHLVTCCVSCNSSKQGLTVRQWYARLRGLGIDTDAVRRRVARTVRRPIDRARGRLLARCGGEDDGGQSDG